MSLFDDLETAANNILIEQDWQNAFLYLYAGGSDGFNTEVTHSATYSKAINIAISRGQTTNGSEYIGTTDETNIQQGDIIEVVDARFEKQRYIVKGYEPTEEHTLLEMEETNAT